MKKEKLSKSEISKIRRAAGSVVTDRKTMASKNNLKKANKDKAEMIKLGKAAFLLLKKQKTSICNHDFKTVKEVLASE